MDDLQKTRLSRRRETLAPTPPISRHQVVSFFQSPVEFTAGRGEQPNNTTTKKPSPLYIIQYSMLNLHHQIKISLNANKNTAHLLTVHTVYMLTLSRSICNYSENPCRQFPFSCSHSIVEVIITRKSLVFYLHSLVGGAASALSVFHQRSRFPRPRAGIFKQSMGART